jgi:hypothetical protein
MGEVNNDNWSKLFDGLDSILSLLEGGAMSEIDDAGVRNSYWLKLLNKLNDIMNAIAEGGGSENYSTEEVRVGTWIDGKPIYKKTVSLGALPNAEDKIIDHGITNLEWLVKSEGMAGNGSGFILLSRPGNEVNAGLVRHRVAMTSITLSTLTDLSTYTTSYLTLWYTKTTD